MKGEGGRGPLVVRRKNSDTYTDKIYRVYLPYYVVNRKKPTE